MLSVVMQNVVLQNVVMQNAVMQNVIMLSVVAPKSTPVQTFLKKSHFKTQS